MAADRSANNARAIGVLGGAFNPPHVAHAILAEEARDQLGLDRLVMVPTGRAGHKLLDSDPGGEIRLEMTAAAVEGLDAIEADDYEIDAAARSGRPSYSHLTLDAFADGNPGAELFLILGTDAAAGFGDWKDPAHVAARATIAVAVRPGSDRAAAEQAIAAYSPGGPRWIEMPALDLSSTAIRERVAAGRPFRAMVGPGVASVIATRGLYR